MATTALVISNHHTSSVGYTSGITGFGWHVTETRTFEAARILIRTGLQPDTIIIDVKLHAHEIEQFIDFIRHDSGAWHSGVIVIGQDYVTGADLWLARPVFVADIISALEPILN